MNKRKLAFHAICTDFLENEMQCIKLACVKDEFEMRSVSFSTWDRDTMMECCFSRHQTKLQQHNLIWELSDLNTVFGRAQTGFSLLCWWICGDSETLLQWQIWKSAFFGPNLQSLEIEAVHFTFCGFRLYSQGRCVYC